MTKEDEILATLKDIQKSISNPKPKEHLIYGVHGLAEYLRCGPAHAHKLKKQGIIPYMQVGRILVFTESDVLAAMKAHTNNRLNNNPKSQSNGHRNSDHS